ncbi:uncharacterized protein I206_100815 [Kwoniella pini CBS 10737]|uniref:Homeobox domain-containing protein n=1 Tax=Kwoniella pini CBS 10737 TaxID=1296096 RepID=A0AAJ8MML6_9TREE
MPLILHSGVIMGSGDRSIRSLPGVSPSFQSRLFHRHDDIPANQQRRERPRSEYDHPLPPVAGTSDSMNYHHSFLPGSEFCEPGPSHSTSRFRPSRPGLKQDAFNQIGPSRLAPYVPADQRYHAPRPADRQWLGADGRRSEIQERPVFPPPPVPAPPHIVASSSRANMQASPTTRERPYSSPFPRRRYSQSPEINTASMQAFNDRPYSSRLPSMGQTSMSAGHFPSNRSSEASHSHRLVSMSPSRYTHTIPADFGHSLSRTFSNESTHSHHSYAMQRDLSGGSSMSGSSYTGTSSFQSGQPYPGGGYKKKRTRALMTHMQQSGLMKLWRKTKFPTGADRERLGQEIGLTPRQVQVWFQNQRQKGRKTLAVNGGIPEGEDPANYEDLQKSPRSRRLSLEGDERISAWTGESSNTASSRFLLDPPSAVSPSHNEPLIRHSRHFPHPYLQEDPASRSVISLPTTSSHENWDHTRPGREPKGKERAQDPTKQSYPQNDPSSHSKSHPDLILRSPESYPSLHSRSRSLHNLLLPSIDTQKYASPSNYDQPLSSYDTIHPNAISPSDKPFPSVLEPLYRPARPSKTSSTPLPPIISPLSAGRSFRSDTRHNQSSGTPPLKRRRTSPETGTNFRFDGATNFTKPRPHMGDDKGVLDQESERERLGSIRKFGLPSSHLPPELARIALRAPYHSEREGDDDYNLPGIDDQLFSPSFQDGDAILSPIDHVSPSNQGDDVDVAQVPIETGDYKSSKKPPEDTQHDLGHDQAVMNEIGVAEETPTIKPISSNLRNLLD